MDYFLRVGGFNNTEIFSTQNLLRFIDAISTALSVDDYGNFSENST